MDDTAKGNPIRIQRTTADPAPPCTLVVIGATGDLTHRLLIPALYNLARWNLLNDDFEIIGIGRKDQNTASFRADLESAIRTYAAAKGGEGPSDCFKEEVWLRVSAATHYLRGDLEDPATYERLMKQLTAGELRADGPRSVLFYLAVAPALFQPVIQRLAASGLMRQEGGAWRRIIVEKPFGHDLASARALNREILTLLSEDQVYRIDHFLGKETVQNIMAFRFGNGIFEPLWNREHIDHVQITVAETVGVEGRGRFYEGTGALRDMVPNHLFQLFTLTAMEPPSSFAADAVRSRKQDVLTATHIPTPSEAIAQAVRGQYGAGVVRGESRRAYRDEPNVSPKSRTETYAAMRLMVDNWRWAGVPFYLRTGKAMTRRTTEIAIRFKQAPLSLFRGTEVQECLPNWLVVRIQPDEGISLHLGAKVPGPAVRLSPVEMNFSYADHFQQQPSTGYETLIYDAMNGDQTLYQRADNIEGGWQIVQPILDAWDNDEAPISEYPAGSAGPELSEALFGPSTCRWRPL
jgi:glucose-6-phosphate 1-dehydrogenase